MAYIIKAKSNNQISFSDQQVIDHRDNHLSQTLFLCPSARINASRFQHQPNKLDSTRKRASRIQHQPNILDIVRKRESRIHHQPNNLDRTFEIDYSPHFHRDVQENESSVDYYKNSLIHENHPILPLFWCNSKDYLLKKVFEKDCYACYGNNKYGQDYYFCEVCGLRYHKECVESPSEIKHSYHPKHFLKLFYMFHNLSCFDCKENTWRMAYWCTICNFVMHPVCAAKPILFHLEQLKRHEHPLTFFTRKVSLDCNVCGFTSDVNPTYVCLKCNFIAHKDCANSPTIIRISRHKHRISFSISFPPREWSCGICSENVDNEYGGYICNKCEDYVVHTRCSLREDIWDKKELEGIPDEDDVEKNIEPFVILKDGRILHFSHEHPLRVETSRVYDEMKICEACNIPIYEGDFYSCMECDFILHNPCANAPRQKQHPLHPHSLTLKVTKGFKTSCKACILPAYGFIYKCETCHYILDVRCASISVPFSYQGHEHSLLLALSPEGVQLCQTCKTKTTYAKALNCIECSFIICFNCVTLPYMARYKYDEHILTLCCGDDKIRELYWCDICEMKLTSTREERFYRCNYGCSTLHVHCLFGKDRYMKPGRICDIQIFPNYTLSRFICGRCHRRCEQKIVVKWNEKIYCSIRCL